MKNIFAIGMVLFLFNLSSAQAASLVSGAPYLDATADAWANVLQTFGPSGAIAYELNTAHTSDLASFRKMISSLAYNTSALTLYNAFHHIDVGLTPVGAPLSSRRHACTHNLPDCRHDTRMLDIMISGIGTYAQWDTDKNNTEFKTRTTGTHVRASGYLTDGLSVGVAYTRTETNTRRTPIYADATTDSLTLFSEYLGTSGLFINMGVNGGRINWANDKSIAGIENSAAYDADFIAGQITSGIQLSRGRIGITPQIGVRYVRLSSDKHIDSAAQEFQKWWYNTLTTRAQMLIDFDFIGDWYIMRPSMALGVGYDALTHGTDAISVRVISGQTYNIPIDTPHRTALNGALGIDFLANDFSIGLDYRLDIRSDYIAHTGALNIKITF